MSSLTVITATARPDGLAMVDACLAKQTFQDFDWIIVAPEDAMPKMEVANPRLVVIPDPPREAGDFYCLNKAWNKAVSIAKTELLLFVVDWVWFESDALNRIWQHHVDRPMCGVSSVGDHFRRVVNGRPEWLWKSDDRPQMVEQFPEHRYECLPPVLMELAFASLPRSKIIEVGGFDSAYDAVAGLSEKELCCRMYEAGVRFILDLDIPIRNFTHPRTNYKRNWDEAYAAAEAMFAPHLAQIESGERRVLSGSLLAAQA